MSLRGVLLGALFAAPFALGCSENRRAVGGECLQDDDCHSRRCVSLVCATDPELFDPSDLPAPRDAGRIGAVRDAQTN